MSYGHGIEEKAVAEQIGRNLVRCRQRSGVSQEELARISELHRTHIYKLEQGKRLAQADTVISLASALDVDPTELLRGISWDPSRKAFYIDGKRAPS